MNQRTQAEILRERGRRAFRKYVNELDITLSEFCRRHEIPYSTLVVLYRKGGCPHRITAKKLVAVSGGKYTLADFGFED